MKAREELVRELKELVRRHGIVEVADVLGDISVERAHEFGGMVLRVWHERPDLGDIFASLFEPDVGKKGRPS